MSLLFSPKRRRMLADSNRWKIVSSVFAPECPETYDPAHMEWLKTHTDSHPQAEAVFCFEGDVACSFESHIYECRPGSILLFDAGERHDHEYQAGSDAVHLWLFFVQKRIIARLVTVMDGKVSWDRRELLVESPDLYNLIAKAWSRSKDSPLEDALKRKRLLAALNLLFVELIELDMKEEERPEDANGGSDAQRRKIVRLIEEHIRHTSGSGLTIDKLARIAGYSKFHFLRVFRRQTGYTVHDYINLARVNRLAEMEAQGSRQKEIAAELGFSCPSAFAHWRTKHVKHKPA